MSATRTTSLAPTVDVETPELVVLTYTIAGVGSRATAALVDYLLTMLAMLLLWVLIGTLGITSFLPGKKGASSDAWTFAILSLATFVLLWGYYVLFEALADGQTPGKRLLRLRVVRDGGYSVTFGASAVRNLLRIIDMQPGFVYFAGIISVAASKTGKRIGDYAAGTIVVREG